MIIYIILLIILITVLACYVKFNKVSIIGSGEYYDGGNILYRTFRETYELVIEKYPESTEIKNYNKVNILENKKIFTELFGPLGVYAQYPGRTLNGRNIEYIQTLISQDELLFEPQICDLHDHLDMSYAPQTCRFRKDGEERVISQTMDNGSSGFRKLITNILEAAFMLPSDAVSEPAAKMEPKYSILVLRAVPGGHVVFCAKLFKNVKFVVYDKDPLFHSDLPKNMSYVSSTLDDPASLAGQFDIVYLNVWAYRMQPEEVAAGLNHVRMADITLIDRYITELQPKVGAVCRFVPPQYEEKQLKERIAVIPSPSDFKTIGGLVLFQPYANKASTECVIIRTIDDIKRGPEPFNYERYETECLAFNLRRVWNTYKPIIKLPSRPEIDISELRKISIYDRCLDCTMFAHYMARYIDKFEPANYGYARIEELILEAEAVQNIEIEIIKNIDMKSNPNANKYDLHGLYKHLTRVQHHSKFVELFSEFIKPITNNKMVTTHVYNKDALDKLKKDNATALPASTV